VFCTGLQVRIRLTSRPSSVKVKYVELKGWETDITAAKSFKDLPENAQKYVQFIEDFVGIKVQYIGVGYVNFLFGLS
jgi:adenylosuccinate synthase